MGLVCVARVRLVVSRRISRCFLEPRFTNTPVMGGHEARHALLAGQPLLELPPGTFSWHNLLVFVLFSCYCEMNDCCMVMLALARLQTFCPSCLNTEVTIVHPNTQLDLFSFSFSHFVCFVTVTGIELRALDMLGKLSFQ